jgi:hypothetical protein
VDEYVVMIDLQGMQRWSTKVEAKCSRNAIDRAWGKWANDPSIAHPNRILSEHKGDLDVYVSRAAQ